jgi:N-acetylglucosamine-6-phosphate deacetylase
MSSTAYINGNVLAGQNFSSELIVTISEGRIESVLDSGSKLQDDWTVIDLEGSYLLPGFIDTQVNGGAGVLFNEHPTVEGIHAIAQAHRQFGTTGLLPTLISDDFEVIQEALSAARIAIESGVPGILGIHIEGPYLNIDRRGVHDATKLRQLTHEIVESLDPLPEGRTMLTLAPETVNPKLVTRLSDKGFIVCAGHSNARQDEVKIALDNGMRGFTHLFNAMSQLTARESGVVGQALVSGDSWCGIIADGHHVSAQALEIAWRCKGNKKLMLVTDAMPPIGSRESSFILFGKRVIVENGICLDEEGTLAGTALDMASAVRNMTRLTSCDFADACIMASSTPAEFLGISDQRGAIRAGYHADFVIMNSNFQVTSTIIGGHSHPTS